MKALPSLHFSKGKLCCHHSGAGDTGKSWQWAPSSCDALGASAAIYGDFRDLTSWMSLTWSPIIFVALFLRLFQFNYVLFESKVPKIALSKVLVTCRRSAIFLK